MRFDADSLWLAKWLELQSTRPRDLRLPKKYGDYQFGFFWSPAQVIGWPQREQNCDPALRNSGNLVQYS